MLKVISTLFIALFVLVNEVKATPLDDVINFFRSNQDQTEETLEQTKIGQQKYHTPIVEDKKTEAIPYLYLPFSKENFQKRGIKITEGWLYSFDEYKIHDLEVHAGVDFAAAYSTPLYSPVEGYAMSSYSTLPALDKDQQVIFFEGKEVRYGLGLFVRIYVPQANRFIDMAHFSEIDEAIPFSDSEYDEANKRWNPSNEKVLISKIPSHPQWVKVSRGQFLGRVGTSGLGWGYDDFEGFPQRKITIDPNIKVSWDEPHLHLEEFFQIQNPKEREELGQKIAPRDIYGIYSFAKDYPGVGDKPNPELKPLIVVDDNGLPFFAR